MTVVLSGYDQSRRPYSELTLTGDYINYPSPTRNMTGRPESVSATWN
jgi:hypothetical protein